jgi:four helix bundle protein
MPAPADGVDERAFRFLCDVIVFARTIGPQPGLRRLVDQLVAAAGSVAANRQEALSASSRQEFIRYNLIALRSANETVVWMRVFHEVGIGDRSKTAALLGEMRQIASILGAIVVKTKQSAAPPSCI